MIAAFLLGFSGAIISVAFLTRIVVGIVANFKSHTWVFQLPIRTNKAAFSDWTFEQTFDKKTGKSFLTIFVQTNRGNLELPTMLVSEWQDFIGSVPGANSNKKQKAGQKNHSSNGKTGSQKQSKNRKSGKSIFVGQADKVAAQVITITPKIDLYRNQNIKLSDGNVAQIMSIQDNGNDIAQAHPGQHVGSGLSVQAVAGAVHKA